MTEHQTDPGERRDRGRRRRGHARWIAVSAALLVVAGAAACGGPEADPEEESTLPATWTIPDDVCARLDLVGIVTANVATPQQPPSAGTEDVEADRAGCAAGAGGGFVVTVELRTSRQRREHALDVKDAQARLDVPSTWSSIGVVDDVPVADDLAPWAASSETAAYSLTVLAGASDVEDVVYLDEVLVADDDNLVAVVTVTSTSPRTRSTAPDEAAAVLAAATAAVPAALGG